MIQPVINLIYGILVLLIAVLFFLPKYGMLAFIQKLRVDKKKILIEDALKFIYELSYSNSHFSKDEFLSNLKISIKKSDELLDQLKEMNLIVKDSNKIELTDKGKEYALKIIRYHRLWERYLADETSENESNWHSIAEQKEHLANENEIQVLDSKIGNALYDPHGDPIPTKDGILPPKKGICLDELTIGETAKILHLEDEPRDIYQKLIELNFSIGLFVKLVKKTDKNSYLEFHDRIVEVNSECSKNINVEKVKLEDNLIGTVNLVELKKGEHAEVVAISRSCRGQQRRRLLDFGIVPGSVISTEIESLGNDPRGYKVRGAIVALRNKTAKQIFVRKVKSIAGN